MTTFENNDTLRIDTGAPNTIESTITVSGLKTIKDVTVSIDIKHTYTADLNIALISPNGVGVVLVAARGRNSNDFKEEHFDDNASTAISDAYAPFNGTYRPEGKLSTFKGVQANGVWTLSVVDNAYRDGGTLNGWSLSIADEKPRYTIAVDFFGGLSASQMAVFSNAAQRWSHESNDHCCCFITAWAKRFPNSSCPCAL
jgi:subtilisin-like proprotein convertase family protein